MLVPELAKAAHLGDFGDELDAGIDEEADAPDRLGERRWDKLA
jgi:hypothetical protein